MPNVQTTIIQLEWKQPHLTIPKESQLRGAIANAFREHELFHQHVTKTKVTYRYPLIQYRCFQKQTILVGFQEGAELLLQLPFVGQRLRLGQQENEIIGLNIQTSTHQVTQTNKLKRYQFVTPWLPFNQQSYKTYRLTPLNQQKRELDRLSVGALLMALKGLSITIDWQLYAAFEQHKTELCRYKKNQFHGVIGELVANIDLPEHIAIGKATSHGFGWLTPIESEHPFL